MTLNKFSIRADVSRGLYEDEPALRAYLEDTWLRMVEQNGGQPAENPGIHITATFTVPRILSLLDPETNDWDHVFVFATGWAYRSSQDSGDVFATGWAYRSSQDSGDDYSWRDAATWIPDDT